MVNRNLNARRGALILVLLAVLNLVSNCAAQTNSQTDWLTGRDFSKARKQIIGITWNQTPLRQSLSNLASRQGVAIFLDRRVDPSQLVNFSFSDKTLEETIMSVADGLQLGAVKIDDRYYYVGPREKVAELDVRRKALFKQLSSFQPVVKQEWMKKEAMNVAWLSESTAIFKQLNESSRVKLSGDKRIQHDLWPDFDLPELSFMDRLIVVSFGFDSWFELSSDGTKCKLVDAGELAAFKSNYRMTLDDEDRDALLLKYPSIKIKQNKRGVEVTASPIVHYEFDRMLASIRASSHRRNPKDGVQVVSFTTGDEDTEIGVILKSVAKMKNATLTYDPDLVSVLKQRIQLEVDQVTYDELLKKTLQSTGLKFRWTETELRITR